MITFNNIVERFEIFAQNHFFIKTFSFGSPDDADLSKFTDFPLMHLVYTGASYDAGTKTYNIEVYILDVPADKNDKVERQKEVVSDAEQCAEDIIADIKNGGNIFLFAQDYEVVNATTTPLEEETKNVLSGVLLDLSVAIPYEWDACNAPIDGVEPGGTEVTYARRGVLRMLTLDGTTDVQSVRTINVTNGTLTDDGDGVVTLDTGGAETLNDLTDVDTTGVTDGQVLKYDNASGEWLPGNDQSATSLGNLDDVSIVTPANREALIYDGSEWVNDTVAKGDIGLGNVDNTSDADKPVSTATQTALNAKANTADVPTSLNDLSDVSIVGTPTGNQALIYDATAGAFKSQVSYTNRFEDEVEIGKEMPTIFAERAYSVKSEGDGIFIDPESDTPAAGKVIVRKIYHKTGFITDADVIGDYTLIHTFADDTAYADTVATFEGFRDGNTYGTPPFTLLQTWEEEAAAPAFTGLLNETYGSGAAAAYGTRRLNGNYSGACMTIRRASDGTTQTIGFVGEEIDESAITTFCTGSTCTVQVWHDQSQTGGTGSGNDLTQSTGGNQPTIYTGGALVKEGGRLTLNFDGTNDDFEITNTGLDIGNLSSFMIGKFETTGSQIMLSLSGGTSPSNKRWYMGYVNGGNINFGYASASTAFSTPVNTNQNLFSMIAGSTQGNASAFLNGNTLGTATLATGLSSDQQAAVGSFNNSFFTDGNIQEVIYYSADKSTDRTDIEGNISAYYQSAKLLDEQFGSGAEAAYSVRQLKRDNTECMVIRRASDSTTTTIGFDGSGNIDEAAIETFCTGTSCTVYQWLDQSGNGNTATAPSTGAEPTIYTGGALVKQDGRVALDFDGTDDYIKTSDYIVELSQNAASVFAVSQSDALSANQYLLSEGDNTDPYSSQFILGGGGDLQGDIILWVNTSTFGVMQTGKRLSGFDYNQTTFQAYLDGNTSGSAAAATVNTETSLYSYIGTRADGTSAFFNGKLQELITYKTNKSSVRTDIESNVGDYFTQNTPLLDTYSGAAAAYSLRLLDSSYVGSAIRVRRSSDNAEQDIGFNVFGELNTVSLLAFAGTGDAFVKVWYDQASTNDATQTNTANQPKIVSSGAVIVENGKPALDFDGTSDYLSNAGNLTYTSGLSIYSVSKFDSLSNTERLFCDDITGAQGFFIYSSSGYLQINDNNTGYLSQTLSGADLTQQVRSLNFNGSTGAYNYAYNGSNTSSSIAGWTGPINSTNTANIGVMGSGNGSQLGDGLVQEIITYPSDQSANRAGIETNIATFYDITI